MKEGREEMPKNRMESNHSGGCGAASGMEGKAVPPAKQAAW
jgi:hypothetical protein